jgi:imidazolonepropionase-like amidohydrolase
MLLLYDTGFEIGDIFQIATYNGAVSLGEDKLHGSIEAGKKANLIIFNSNPYDSLRNILKDKIVVKDGVIL